MSGQKLTFLAPCGRVNHYFFTNVHVPVAVPDPLPLRDPCLHHDHVPVDQRRLREHHRRHLPDGARQRRTGGHRQGES